MSELDTLREAITELRRKRNSLRAWSTTNRESDLLRAMAAEAGMAVDAYKRHAAELADDAELKAAYLENAEAKLQKIDAAKQAEGDKLQTLKVERAQLELAKSPEERQAAEEAADLDAELRDLAAELKILDERLRALWEAICEAIGDMGYQILARSLERVSEPRKPAALRRAQQLVGMPVIG